MIRSFIIQNQDDALKLQQAVRSGIVAPHTPTLPFSHTWMTPADAARARSRAYRLFSRLYREGPSSGLRPALEAVPELAATLGERYDADEAAADHHHVFGLNVFPFASVFLDDDGHLGGAVTDHARRALQQAGYATPLSGESADHLHHALDALAALSAAEAEAWYDDRPDAAEHARGRQRRLFDAYLLWWLPGFALALRQQAHPFYTPLAELTEGLALDHRAALGPPADTAAALVPSHPPPLLDDPKTGLKEIAGYLTTHAWCGFYLSRDDVAHLGRHAGVPRGFGHRALMLTNLLRAAAEFDRLDALVNALAGLVQPWRVQYRAVAGRNGAPLDLVAKTWLDRLDATDRMLERLRTAALSQDANRIV